jgi:hypothetical protein
MPTPLIGKFTERIQFFEGQRLFASDLQDLEQFNREMRRLHNQSLHQPGVASGYAVSGQKDDREVTIQPGYAIDAYGREIVLTEPLVLQVPPVANDSAGRPVYYDLVVSYPADAELTENRAGVCVSRGAVRLREAPLFCWVELTPTDEPSSLAALAEDRTAKLASLKEEIQAGLRLRLARAEVFNCKLNQPLSIAQRRNARPAQQPYTFAGRTLLNGDWTATSSADAANIELTLKVDTSVAQFRSVPRYFAHVVGERQVTVDQGRQLILDGFGRPKPNTVSAKSFVFSLLVPSMFFTDTDDLTAIARALTGTTGGLKEWYVEWLGIEG